MKGFSRSARAPSWPGRQNAKSLYDADRAQEAREMSCNACKLNMRVPTTAWSATQKTASCAISIRKLRKKINADR